MDDRRLKVATLSAVGEKSLGSHCTITLVGSRAIRKGLEKETIFPPAGNWHDSSTDHSE